MRISFFGSSLVSCYWNGAATYYRGLLKALSRLGHEIHFFEPDAFERQAHRDITDPDWARVIVYPATDDGWRKALEQGAEGADLIVKASGVGVFDAELEIAVSEIGSAGMLTAFWDVDAPATLDSIASDPASHLRSAIAKFDAVFTYGGGEPVVSRYRALGARDCIPIYNAVDPESHFPVGSDARFAGDISFLGNRLPDREARVEDFFLRAAACLPERTFILGGAGWETKALPPNVRLAGHVGTGDHNAFFGSATATLNINRDSMAKNGFSPPTRVFEAAGAGACLITDAWEGIDQFLEPNREILVVADGDELCACLGRLSASDAQAIGRAARRRVLSEHTYTHRAQQVSTVLGASSSREAAA